MIRFFGMILSAIIGLILRENANPFLQANKKQKLLIYLQIAFIIAIISFISSFIRIISFDFLNGLLIPLIIVNCPLGVTYFWKRKGELIHFIILVNSCMIFVFLVYNFTLPFYSGQLVTSFPPLSFPFTLYQREVFLSIPNPNRNFSYYSSFVINFIVPIIGIPISENSLRLSYNEEYHRLLENLRLQNQFYIFLLFLLINYITIFVIMKFYAIYKEKLDIAKILIISCRTTVLLANISFVSLLTYPFFIYYWLDRLLEYPILEEIYGFLFLTIAIISLLVLAGRFYMYPIHQTYFRNKTIELLLISVVGLAVLFSIWLIEINSPQKNHDFSSLPQIIIIDIITILMTLLLLYKPVTPKQSRHSDEVVLQVRH